MATGIIYAFIVSVFFSLYLIPRKFSKETPAVYTMFMGMGFFIPSVFYAILLPNYTVLFNPLFFLSVFVGITWMAASILFVTAIDKLGLSRSNQWKNIQGPVGAGLSLVILSEYQTTNTLYIMIAIGAIFVSAALFSIKKKSEKVIDKNGIWYAIIAGLLFGSNSVIQKYVTINVEEIAPQQLYFSSGVFFSAMIYILFQKKNWNDLKDIFTKNAIMPFLAGLIYFIASQFAIMTNKLIPNSVGFTIIQFNAVWTIFIGILVFKEINLKVHWKRILLGLIFAVISIAILSFCAK